MSINCDKINVKKGSQGETVKEIQKYLTFKKLYSRSIDGDCGTYTIEAIKKLQKQVGVVVDGEFGPKTCKASGINGTDISASTNSVKLTVFKDMITRFDKYLKEKGVEANIVYIDPTTKYEYVTKSRYHDMKNRYDQYLKDKGVEPLIIYINKGSTSTNTNSTVNQTLFTSSPHYETQGPDKLGQSNAYRCGPHSFKQILRKFGITAYSEATIGGYMGTTTAGTGHSGIETGIAKISSLTGVKMKVQWKNFSDLGSTRSERFKALGKLIADKNTGVIAHNLYRNQYGHYECLKSINTSLESTVVLNSLGNKCTSVGYCGYLETRSYGNWVSYFNGISQKSLCIITKV